MPRADLKGLRVLVTRPAHQAEALCQRIDALGGEAIRFPVLAIEGPADKNAVQAQLANLSRYDWAIFISPNAVRRSFELLKQQGQSWPKSLKAAVVGAGTARTLEEILGRPADLCPSERFDSEGLLALPELQSVADKNILILRGEGGREWLADTLKARGAKVAYAEVYRRVQPNIDPQPLVDSLQQGKLDILTVTSSEGLQNLLTMLGDEGAELIRQQALIVVSERSARQARELGFTGEIRIAAKASDEGLVESLIDWQLAGEREHD